MYAPEAKFWFERAGGELERASNTRRPAGEMHMLTPGLWAKYKKMGPIVIVVAQCSPSATRRPPDARWSTMFTYYPKRGRDMAKTWGEYYRIDQTKRTLEIYRRGSTTRTPRPN